MFGRKKITKQSRDEAIARLHDSASKRNIEIHSVNAIDAKTGSPTTDAPDYYRIAFSVTDPPGPYSLQFLEVQETHGGVDQMAAIESLKPELAAIYYESLDEARLRAIETESGEIILPRDH